MPNRITFLIIGILFILIPKIQGQHEIPNVILECQDYKLEHKCTCLTDVLRNENESNNYLVKAYAHYYLGISECNQDDIEFIKFHLDQARHYWSRANYNGHRVSYTYLYLASYFYDHTNVDSIHHYADKIFSIPVNGNAGIANNLKEGLVLKSWCYRSVGDYYEAYKILNNFLNSENFKILEPYSKIWFLFNIGNEAANIYSKTHLEKGIEFHEASLSLLDKEIMIDQEDKDDLYAINVYGIARCNYRLGNFKIAYDKYLESFDIFLRLEDVESTASTYNALARTSLALGEIENAQKWSNEALDFYSLLDRDIEFASSPFITLAKSYALSGQIERSDSLFREGLHVAYDKNKVLPGLHDMNIDNASNPLNLIVCLIELAKNNVLKFEEVNGSTDNLRDARTILNVAYGQFHRLITQYKEDASKYHLKEVQYDIFGYSILIEFLLKDDEELFRIIDRNKQSILLTDRNWDNEKIEFSELTKFVQSDQTIIQYGQTLDSVLAITLDSHGTRTIMIDSKKSIDSLTKLYFSSISDPGNINYRSTSSLLFNKLINPLNIKTEKIIIIPDGELVYLPFGSLLYDESDKMSFLEHKYIISYQLSMRLLFNILKRKVKSVGLGAFAPTFDADPSMLYATVRGSMEDADTLFHLPNAQKEVDQICKLWNTIPISPSKVNVLNALSDLQIFHFSGHAISYADSPDNSFLALGSNINDSGQKLILKELYEVDCNNEMVVLSACETGVGALAKGEGVLSMARGFIYAGAKSVISTLWPANDQSSAAIMNVFYKELKKGNAKDEALRNAKLAYLEKADPKFRHPYYWASFIPVGDMNPLVYQYSQMKIMLISFLVILLVFFGLRYSSRRRSKV